MVTIALIFAPRWAKTGGSARNRGKDDQRLRGVVYGKQNGMALSPDNMRDAFCREMMLHSELVRFRFSHWRSRLQGGMFKMRSTALANGVFPCGVNSTSPYLAA